MTGGSGYAGTQLLPALLAEGRQVRVLARRQERLPPSWRSRVEVHQGDLGDPHAVAEALKGVEVAYHLVHSTGPGKAIGLSVYAAWCSFATALSGVARFNRERK